jgi:putative salt-induced outer membrane protein YdiY
VAFTALTMADQVVLTNGDRISGSVIKKDAKELTFKGDLVGSITVPWDKVRSLESEKPVYVVLPGDKTVQARIESKDDRVELVAESETQAASLSDLIAIRNAEEQVAYERLLNPAWTRLWAGTATLAFAGARGNARSLTLNTGFNAARVTRTDRLAVQLNAIRASALVDEVSAATAQAVRGGWAYDRVVVDSVTWNIFNDYESDRFQNLDMRFVAGGGLGYIVWRGERGRLDLKGGGAYNREAFSDNLTQPAFTREAGEVYFGDEFTYKLSPVTSVIQSSRSFLNLTRGGEYRLNLDVGTNTRLTRWLTWNASVSDRYLSNPVPGRRKNDFLYTTGIGVTFSR